MNTEFNSPSVSGIRIIQYSEKRPPGIVDCDLIHILRALSAWKYTSVIGARWIVSDLEFYPYRMDWSISNSFPEFEDVGSQPKITISGERLMELSSLIHQFESGLFLRVKNSNMKVDIIQKYQLMSAPCAFQATNVDIEIRIGDFSHFEVIAEDVNLIEFLASAFSVVERI